MTIADFESRFLNYQPKLMGVKRKYAVLVPLVDWEGELCLLLEVRASTLRTQPGEVCFPGGAMDGEESATTCALRETWEELGIPVPAMRPLARLDILHQQGNFLLHPVLAHLDTQAVAEMSPNPEEVGKTLLVPLKFFQENPPQEYTFPLHPEVGEDFPFALLGYPEGNYPWRRVETEIPIWVYEGHVIWGMTARIIRHLLAQMAEG